MSVKIAVFAPIPSASDRIATTVKVGLRVNCRRAKRMSLQKVSMRRLPRNQAITITAQILKVEHPGFTAAIPQRDGLGLGGCWFEASPKGERFRVGHFGRFRSASPGIAGVFGGPRRGFPAWDGTERIGSRPGSRARQVPRLGEQESGRRRAILRQALVNLTGQTAGDVLSAVGRPTGDATRWFLGCAPRARAGGPGARW